MEEIYSAGKIQAQLRTLYNIPETEGAEKEKSINQPQRNFAIRGRIVKFNREQS